MAIVDAIRRTSTAGAIVGHLLGLLTAIAAVLLLVGTVRTAARAKPPYRSPFDLAFSADGSMLAVTDCTAGRLYVVDASTGALAREIGLRGKPMTMAWEASDKVLVCEYDAGTVAQANVRTGEVLRRFSVGPKPVGLAIAARKRLLIVCDYGLHTACIVDLQTGNQRARVPCGKHPCLVAVTPDEEMAVVSNLLPAGPATDPSAAAVVSVIDLDRGSKLRDIALPGSSSNARQVAISPDGRWAYIVHTIGRTTLPTTQLDRGWVNTNALTIIDLAEQQRYATMLLDTVTEGAADPWGIALSADGTRAWISIAGVHQIATVQLDRLHDFLAGRGDIRSLGLHDGGSGPAVVWQEIKEDPAKRDELSYHLSALYAADMLSRSAIPAKCPRGVALSPDGKQLAVASYYSGEVLLVDPDRCRVTRTISLGPQPEPDDVRHGEFVFFDGRHSFQHWLSCGTCHPDARADGMNWDLINDGIGNPKNARSMLWSHKTPPVMSLGVRESMEEAAEKGFKFIHFREIEKGDLDAVRAYLQSLEPQASPLLVDGRLSEKAEKGRRLFEDPAVGCARCHPAPLFTSLEAHDVGTRHELDRTDRFDTPTCVELWRTGPYLHDGSAVTLKDVLTTMNRDDRHGKTSHLNEDEIDALVEYLLSL